MLGAFGHRAHAQDWSGEIRLIAPGTEWRESHPRDGRRFDGNQRSAHHTVGIGGRAFGPEERGIIAEATWLVDSDIDAFADEYSNGTSLFVARVGFARRRIVPMTDASTFTVTKHVSLMCGRETWIGKRDCYDCYSRPTRRSLRGNVLFGARVGVDLDFHHGAWFWGFGLSYSFVVHLGDNDMVGVASHLFGFNFFPRIGFSFGPSDPVRPRERPSSDPERDRAPP